MKISGRIILQKPEPVPVDLTRKELAKWLFGYFRATHDAAQVATEADALMAEMAEAIEALNPHNTGVGMSMDWQAYHEAQNKARLALQKHEEYVK